MLNLMRVTLRHALLMPVFPVLDVTPTFGSYREAERAAAEIPDPVAEQADVTGGQSDPITLDITITEGDPRGTAFVGDLERVNRQAENLAEEGTAQQLITDLRVRRHSFENLQKQYPEYAGELQKVIDRFDAEIERLRGVDRDTVARIQADIEANPDAYITPPPAAAPAGTVPYQTYEGADFVDDLRAQSRVNAEVARENNRADAFNRDLRTIQPAAERQADQLQSEGGGFTTEDAITVTNAQLSAYRTLQTTYPEYAENIQPAIDAIEEQLRELETPPDPDELRAAAETELGTIQDDIREQRRRVAEEKRDDITVVPGFTDPNFQLLAQSSLQGISYSGGQFTSESRPETAEALTELQELYNREDALRDITDPGWRDRYLRRIYGAAPSDLQAIEDRIAATPESVSAGIEAQFNALQRQPPRLRSRNRNRIIQNFTPEERAYWDLLKQRRDVANKLEERGISVADFLIGTIPYSPTARTYLQVTHPDSPGGRDITPAEDVAGGQAITLDAALTPLYVLAVASAPSLATGAVRTTGRLALRRGITGGVGQVARVTGRTSAEEVGEVIYEEGAQYLITGFPPSPGQVATEFLAGVGSEVYSEVSDPRGPFRYRVRLPGSIAGVTPAVPAPAVVVNPNIQTVGPGGVIYSSAQPITAPSLEEQLSTAQVVDARASGESVATPAIVDQRGNVLSAPQTPTVETALAIPGTNVNIVEPQPSAALTGDTPAVARPPVRVGGVPTAEPVPEPGEQIIRRESYLTDTGEVSFPGVTVSDRVATDPGLALAAQRAGVEVTPNIAAASDVLAQAAQRGQAVAAAAQPSITAALQPSAATAAQTQAQVQPAVQSQALVQPQTQAIVQPAVQTGAVVQPQTGVVVQPQAQTQAIVQPQAQTQAVVQPQTQTQAQVKTQVKVKVDLNDPDSKNKARARAAISADEAGEYPAEVTWIGVNRYRLNTATGHYEVTPLNPTAAETAKVTRRRRKPADGTHKAGAATVDVKGKDVTLSQQPEIYTRPPLQFGARPMQRRNGVGGRAGRGGGRYPAGGGEEIYNPEEEFTLLLEMQPAGADK